MPPQPLTGLVIYDAPLLKSDDSVGSAVEKIAASGLPALPVVDRENRVCGTFGEREFIGAIFPGYLEQLHATGFLTEAIDAVVDRRAQCGDEPVSTYMATDQIAVPPTFAAAHLAEIFLHRPALIVPVVDQGRVVGVATRSRFFAALVERLAGR